MNIERYHTAYQKAVHDHVLPLMIADGLDTEQAEALLAGMLRVKYEGFVDYVRETLTDFALAVNGESRGYEVIEEMMTADGYSKSWADAFAEGVSYAAFANPGLSCGVDSDDVAKEKILN